MTLMLKIRTIALFICVAALGFAKSNAQNVNLTAAQMNIYFGQPKKVTMTNPQGTATTEFDRDGRILSITQGNLRMVYDWAPSGDKVTLSMFQGPNIQDSGIVEIAKMAKSHYKYIVGGMMTFDVMFKSNGAIEKMAATSPQMTITATYYYHNADDVFPYAIEQAMGDQALKAAVTINKTDSYGNAIEFTQEAMGQKNVSRLTIEYY